MGAPEEATGLPASPPPPRTAAGTPSPTSRVMDTLAHEPRGASVTDAVPTTRFIRVDAPVDGHDGVALVTRLNELAGAHGIGRVDHIEDRLVGIKSREVYEAPAAMLLHSERDFRRFVGTNRSDSACKGI